MKKTKEPDIIKQYESIREFITKNEVYLNQLADAQIEADYKGDLEKKRELQHIEANYQEVVNLMYEVVGFIECKWME